jgi:hypothetical protein
MILFLDEGGVRALGTTAKHTRLQEVTWSPTPSRDSSLAVCHIAGGAMIFVPTLFAFQNLRQLPPWHSIRPALVLYYEETE